MIAADEAVITSLQLRFGGCAAPVRIAPHLLHQRASALPPQAPLAAVALI